MLIYFWELLLIKPIFNFLVFFNQYFGNLGIAIIVLTIVVKFILIPLNIPTVRMQGKKKVLDEELKIIKEKYTEKADIAKAQMELYKKHGVNPASGCLPLVIQMFVFIALYTVLNDLLKGITRDHLFYYPYLMGNKINTQFLYLDLSKPDKFFILPIFAGASQFIMTKMLMPSIKKGTELAEKTKTTTDDFIYNIQQQMLYISPIMTLVIGTTLPSGLALYWTVSTFFSVFQNIIINKFLKK